MTELSIVVPAYQDAETLPRAIEELHGVVTHASIFAEVLIVDDESTDDTVQVASALAERFPALHIRVFARKRRRHGFGGLVRFGLAHATGRYAALVSSDGRDPVELLPEMLKKLRSGAQLVLCSRYTRSEDSRKVAIRYRLYQVIYRQLVRWLLARELTDTTYAFRAFNRIYVEALGTSSARFNICPEITFKVLLSGGQIDYVAGSPNELAAGGSEKFKLPNEILGYAYVLFRSALHRAGLLWF